MSRPTLAAQRPRTSEDYRTRWLERFEARVGDAGAGIPWLAELRRKAIGHFAVVGFPTRRDEDWKYTSLTALHGDFDCEVVGRPWPSEQPRDGTIDRGIGDPAWSRLAFVNGVAMSGPTIASRPHQPWASSLAAAIVTEPAVEETIGHLARFDANGLVALNTAFFRDGAFIAVPAGANVSAPIQLVYASSTDGSPVASHPRNLVILGPGSSATLVETYTGVCDAAALTNAVTEVVLGDGAVLTHCKIVLGGAGASHVGTTSVLQGRLSAYKSLVLSFGGDLVRNDLRVVLSEEGADCTLMGVYVGSGSEHVDNHTVIVHAAPHGSSRQVYKGILDERAHGVFNGKIFVRPGAQKTDARQTNKNLLLSSDASVDTKPQLEILADDVKCAHGATVGQLDPEKLFYLKSRALGGDAARSLLTYGFAAEILDGIRPTSLRSHVTALLAHRLGAESLAEVAP